MNNSSLPAWRTTTTNNNKYDLSHLNQDGNQYVGGSIQDDEALLLYSLIRCSLIKRILESGAGIGYSAKNFLQATSIFEDSIVYSVDINIKRFLQQDPKRHKSIIKSINLLEPDDVDNLPLDLVFFDSHKFNLEIEFFNKFYEKKIITDDTIICIHDTNLSPIPLTKTSKKIDNGWVFGKDRRLVNFFIKTGYKIFNIHTNMDRHNSQLPFRNGLTLCQKNNILKT
jgi:predicted O-methyltransferase YrrM